MSTSQQPTAADSVATPVQLANSTIHQPPADTTGATATKEPSSAAGKEQCEQFQSFMSLVHSYLMSAITFADQKAGFLFATDSAFLGYLLSNGLLLRIKAPVSAWHLVQWASIASLLLLGASNVMAVLVVMPRLGGRHTGLIYFKAISRRKRRSEYVNEVLSSTGASLNVALSEHCYEIAGIATRKYTHLRTGMWLGALGFLAGLAYIGLSR
jgi:Pycsar effector protein